MNKKSVPKRGGFSAGFGCLLFVALTLALLGCTEPSSKSDPLKGSVTITGTAQVGQELAVNTSGLLGKGTIRYQWNRGSAQTGLFVPILLAIFETYTPTADDEGKYLAVTVTRSGYSGSITSNSVGPVLSESAVAPTVTSVIVSPTTPNVTKGATQQFSAEVTGTGNPSQTVTWSVAGGGTGTTITANGGLLTVSANETAVTLIVTATSTADPEKSGSATVTVVSPPTVTGVTISPKTATVAKNGTQTFIAEVHGTNNPAQTVTWSLTGGGTGTTIVNGLLTVSVNETAATLTVRATSTVDTTKSDTATVTVSGTATVTGVTLDPPSPTVAKGGTQQFTASVTGTNNPAQTVTWDVTGGVSGTGIFNGLLTVSANETATTLTVKATSIVDTTKFGTATVTVVVPPTVTSVTVTPASANVAAGAFIQFAASVTGTNNPAQTVTWSVNGVSETTIVNGLLTVAANETAATLTVRATSIVDTTKSGTATVTVTRSPLTGAVIINGSARAGNTLTVNTNNLFGIGTISYQWQQGDTATGTFTNISGATASTYVPVTGNVGKFLRVSVTRTGNTGTVTSSAAGPVQAAPAPGETDQVNGTVTVKNGVDDVTVSFSNTGNITLAKNGTLTITVSGAYQAYRWYVNTVLLSDETAASITLDGNDYESGDHRILVIVYRSSVPYSQEIRFTVN